jgi:hypothetical protein
MLGMVVHACHLSYAGSIDSRIVVYTSLGKTPDPIQKNYLKQKGLGTFLVSTDSDFKLIPTPSKASHSFFKY